MPVDPRVDAYIAAAAPFAPPILRHFRELVHATIPAATETIKWGMPFFQHKDRPLAMMAAFKAHAGIGIFNGTAMAGGDSMGQFGKLTKVADLLDAEALAAMLVAAAALIDAGIRPARVAAKKPPLPVPDDLRAALAALPEAAAAFDGFPPGAQREYVEWVIEAKQPATRARRIAQTVEQCAQGKKRYWNMSGR
jgi:uncharacterized protein YdeI (YjbR/CyaY-like superfamily)